MQKNKKRREDRKWFDNINTQNTMSLKHLQRDLILQDFSDHY